MLDFYHVLLAALGAPKWHSESPDALVDSMIWGGINAVEPPYTIRISGVENAPKDVREAIDEAKQIIAEGRAYYQQQEGRDVEVSIETERSPD